MLENNQLTHSHFAACGGMVAFKHVQNCLPEQREVLLRRRIGHFVRVRAAAVLNEICDPVDEHRGFTAAGSGQQQQWAFRSQDRLSLHIVQVREVRRNKASARLHIPLLLFKSHRCILHSV